MSYGKSIFVFAMITLGSALAGCGDPAGPGASGSISLGTGVSQSGFKALHLRAIPDAGEAFDPVNPQFTASAPADGPAWDPGIEDLQGMTFPHAYSFGAVLGTTREQHFRLFAWLSADVDTSADPKSGEPYGTTTFDVGACGVGYGDYCGTTEGVNLTIDQKAP
jgi:hypothetical protein